MSTIIVLNGTSSSGKTSIAKAFQEMAPRIFLNFSIDSILYALPDSALQRIIRGDDIRDLRYDMLARGYYACVAELARLGHDLVIDDAVTSRFLARLLVDAVAGHDTLLAGLDCDVAVLTQREEARRDRRPGMAAKQSQSIHSNLVYDVRIDSGATAPHEAARLILDRMRSGSFEGVAATAAELDRRER